MKDSNYWDEDDTHGHEHCGFWAELFLLLFVALSCAAFWLAGVWAILGLIGWWPA